MIATLQAKLLAFGAVVLAVLAALAAVFRAGKKSAQHDQARESLNTLRQRSKTEDAVAQMDDARVRERLGRWMPDDKRH